MSHFEIEDAPLELRNLEEEAGEEVLKPLEDLDAEGRVRFMANVADSLRASDIIIMDLRPLTIIADFFLVCTGNSSIQIRAIADRIEEELREIGYRKLRVEGYKEATWILLDYGDVVVHAMAAEQRAFYDLEEFWVEAPRLELELVPEPTALRLQAAPLWDED